MRDFAFLCITALLTFATYYPCEFSLWMVTKNRLLIKWQEELGSIVVLCGYMGHKRFAKRYPELPVKHT